VRFALLLAAESVTTGPEIIRSGAAAAISAAVGFVWVHFFIPPMSRFMGFGEWYGKPFVRLWNYGLLALVGACGVIAMLVGAIAWATGTTFR
jgi:hypothetical protein